MAIDRALEIRIGKLQRLQENEKQKQRLEWLPPLTSELERIASGLNRLLKWRCLWVDVYQQPAVPSDRTFKQALNKPFKIITDSTDVFNVSRDEIDDFQEALRDLVDQIGPWQRKLEEQTAAFCEQRSQAVKTTQALLRVPDLLDDKTERQRLERLLDDLLKFLDVENMQHNIYKADELGEKWQAAWNEYEALQSRLSLDAVSRRFNLSQQALSTLSRFVNGETLQLGNVPASVLQELQQINRFATQVTLKFEAKLGS